MKTYWLRFGSGNPADNTGLAPTLIYFFTQNGATLAAPGITEMMAGSGLYRFQYAPTLSIVFVADGGNTLTGASRYVTGVLDPIQAVDEKVGTTGDSFGSTSADPSSVLGYLKRVQELFEGDAVFTKATGVWSIYSRGSSTLLRTKTLTNNLTEAEKS
jgi:hypothetical protein